jgi:hypothetical protein
LLWFEVDDFDAVIQRARDGCRDGHTNRNPSEGNGGPNHWECWIRDPDGYIVVIASPDGTALSD